MLAYSTVTCAGWSRVVHVINGVIDVLLSDYFPNLFFAVFLLKGMPMNVCFLFFYVLKTIHMNTAML